MLKGRFSHPCKLIVKGLHLLFVAVMLFAGLGAARAQLTQAGPDGGVSPEGLLNPDGTLDLSTGLQGTLDLHGWEVTLDSQRGPILKRASQLAAGSDPAWNALPNQGLSGAVWALAVVGSDLYVGGGFTQTGDGSLTDLGHIARYDTAARTWYPLPNQGLSSGVCALTVASSDLYVGGDFAQTADGSLTNLGGMARYDTAAGTWHALPNQGLNAMVWQLAVNGSDLYVGGEFTQTSDGSLTNLGGMARYDTAAGTWHALPHQGLNDDVQALAVVGSDLYVGGRFTQTSDGSMADLGHIARYDTAAGTWHALPNQGLNHFAFALAVVGNDLYAAGYVSSTGDGSLTDLGHIARYDTAASTWHALPNQGLNATIWKLAVVGSDLYVGGLFTQTDDGSLTDLGYIARYDTTTIVWRAPPQQGLNDDVRALAVAGSDLYVGGEFTSTGDGLLTDLGHIVRYDTAAGTWHALPHQGLNDYVYALAVVGSDLYVGGRFAQTGDGSLTDLGNVARYDTAARTWHALPHQGLNGHVYALAVADSDLYAGGLFSQTGDGALTNLGNIARYDTVTGTWNTLPNRGFVHSVRALAASGSDLYVGGFFTQTGDGSLTNLGHIARYDTVAGTWNALPDQGLNNHVLALALVESDLYVGGAFSQTGDGSLTNLGGMARYDTAAGLWNALANQGLNGYVYTLATSTRDLYAGGGFNQTGDGTVTGLRNIARYCLPPYELFLPLLLRG